MEFIVGLIVFFLVVVYLPPVFGKLMWIGGFIWICFIEQTNQSIITRIFVFLLMAGYPMWSLISNPSSWSFYDADDIGDDGGGE